MCLCMWAPPLLSHLYRNQFRVLVGGKKKTQQLGYRHGKTMHAQQKMKRAEGRGGGCYPYRWFMHSEKEMGSLLFYLCLWASSSLSLIMAICWGRWLPGCSHRPRSPPVTASRARGRASQWTQTQRDEVSPQQSNERLQRSSPFGSYYLRSESVIYWFMIQQSISITAFNKH